MGGERDGGRERWGEGEMEEGGKGGGGNEGRGKWRKREMEEGGNGGRGRWGRGKGEMKDGRGGREDMGEDLRLRQGGMPPEQSAILPLKQNSEYFLDRGNDPKPHTF